MTKHFALWIIIPVALMVMQTANAASTDSSRGEKLHQEMCGGCHSNEVYTRKNRTIASKDQLIGQVNACNHVITKELGQDQVDDLIQYLNDTYYKF